MKYLFLFFLFLSSITFAQSSSIYTFYIFKDKPMTEAECATFLPKVGQGRILSTYCKRTRGSEYVRVVIIDNAVDWDFALENNQ